MALQTELTKGSQAAPLNGAQTNASHAAARQSAPQRTLISANFVANPLQNGTRALGRNILSAGDKLRDLIVPDALAAVVSAPAWIPGMGGRRQDMEKDGGKTTEKLRAELDDVLASNCPLCESVVMGLDKPFVKEGEVDTTWAL